ncbi:MAG: polysaccharide deacetylase family protein [Bacilli bacterium]|nr:polysaccharide deacetylase family protein [Bacilli bacterium]
MKSSKKKKVNVLRIILVLLSLFIIMFLIYNLVNKKDNYIDEKILMINIINKNINEIKEELSKYDIDINITYEYDDVIEKDKVISQSISEGEEIEKLKKLEIVVSLGKLDKDKLKKDKINELGKVPIMMYHGIKNIKNSDTLYIGGNVDKDGYTRTAESFRKDLEFYYQEGYRMIKLSDYVNGVIDVPYGYSPIILTFDDGNDNNIKVTGLDSDGNIIIDPNSAVGILEEFKKKYKDYNVTAIFFLTNNLFNQPEYNEKIIEWLIDNGYEVGNHTKGHNNFSNIETEKTEEVVGYMYDKLESIIGNKYSKIVALPFGSPYNKNHENYSHILNGIYNGEEYQTIAALRVGWEPEVSPFNKNFDATFLKRCRAYDNNGKDFDIDMVFNKQLVSNRYISDGNINTITTSSNNESLISEKIDKKVILY